MEHLRAVLRSLRVAGLTANPRKCAIGRVEVRYLGFHLGHGQVRPQIDKTATVAACPSPKTKKEVRQVLGLAGYYRRFIPNFSDLTSLLTDLTKKEAPDPVQWTELCQQAITKVKAALCGGPLLHSPNFDLPFLLQTDASDRGLGAVLAQVVGREDQAWNFSLCFVCGSRPWGAAAFHLCLFILLLKCIKYSPVPASFFPYLRTVLHWCRNPGGRRDTLSESPHCLGGSRCWGDRAAGRSGDRQWLPEAVVLEQWKSRWDGRLAAVLLGRGGVADVREGAEESAAFASGPEPAAIRQVGGGAGNGGLAAGCPRLEEPSPSARRRRSVKPSTKDVQYHRMAPRVRAAQLVEDRAAVCPGTGPRCCFFFFLPSLFSVTPHPSVSFSLASSVLTPRYATAALTGSPRERGEGGSRAQSRGYPPACEGRWVMWRVGRGWEPWERSEAGGVNGNERHLRHSPVSSPTEELRKG